MHRIFLVGCPRSGTTILQREISTHLGLCTFPETSFLALGLETIQQRAAALWRLHNRVQAQFRGDVTYPHFNRFIKTLEVARFYRPRIGSAQLLKAFLSKKEVLKAWRALMDTVASQKGFGGWLEKSPTHFYHLDTLRETANNVRILFVVRNGRDVVASIIHRARSFPDRFGHEDINHAIILWNNAVRVALREVNADDMALINFEDFVDDPASVVERIGTFCGIEPNLEVSTQPSSDSDFAFAFETWKSGAKESVSKPDKKWDTVFTDRERRHVEETLDWESYRKLEFLS